MSQSDIAAGLGVFLGFFGAFALGSRTSVQIDTSSEDFSLTFDAIFETFEILPGDWYDTTAIDSFRNGPFEPGSPTDNLSKAGALFGPRGFLSFRPIRMIVAYNPKLSISLDRTSYQYMHQVTSGFGGFCIGPFIIGGGAYYDSNTTVTHNDDSFSFGFEIKDYAVLIASDSEEI